MFLSIRRKKKKKNQLESKCLPIVLHDLNNFVLSELCAHPLESFTSLKEFQFSSPSLVGSRSEIEIFRSSSKSLHFSSALLV